jgi:hypothetical protein
MTKGGAMFYRLSCLATAVMAVASVATAAEHGAVPVPSAVRALFVLDAASVAKYDASDRYSAHLILGGADRPSGTRAEPITGFWADSFGGSFTATG